MTDPETMYDSTMSVQTQALPGLRTREKNSLHFSLLSAQQTNSAKESHNIKFSRSGYGSLLFSFALHKSIFNLLWPKQPSWNSYPSSEVQTLSEESSEVQTIAFCFLCQSWLEGWRDTSVLKSLCCSHEWKYL